LGLVGLGLAVLAVAPAETADAARDRGFSIASTSTVGVFAWGVAELRVFPDFGVDGGLGVRVGLGVTESSIFGVEDRLALLLLDLPDGIR